MMLSSRRFSIETVALASPCCRNEARLEIPTFGTIVLFRVSKMQHLRIVFARRSNKFRSSERLAKGRSVAPHLRLISA